jgi:hypothetical protein
MNRPYDRSRLDNGELLDEIGDVLEQIDPDIGYGDWVQVLMAIFNLTRSSAEGFELADAWSSGGQKYKGTADVRKAWRYFRLDHPRALGMRRLREIAARISH